MTGAVEILSVGEGDIKLSFDPANPAERIRAARIVKDMLRRGYALLVEHPVGSGKYQRAKKFDDKKCEYIVADFDPIEAEKADEQETEVSLKKTPAATSAPGKRGGARKTVDKRIPAESTKAVSVARTAGG